MLNHRNLRPKRQTFQWNGDNLRELETALSHAATHLSQSNGVLRILGIGLDLYVQLGETLIIEEDRIGVLRHKKPTRDWITWTGRNFEDFAAFLDKFNVRIGLAGDRLMIHGGARPFILSRGDRLINRNGQIIVSIKGRDHRDG